MCLDESSKQLLAETRVPIPMKPGRPARCDYEYERNGTANLFMMFARLEGWRHVKVTDRYTAVDYAHVLKDLADVHFANAKTIILVQDNLNIHSTASLYEAFPGMGTVRCARLRPASVRWRSLVPRSATAERAGQATASASVRQSCRYGLGGRRAWMP
ncbi:hypothetical protein M2222_009416 [Bradyrhizobium elkanii]|nr:hypothetical protein [Bradyrhizobium elkanii]MCS3567035.1 hypothetical protein [Bradyrhizobium elkanii]MCW2153936.1 hypothetical protein [Bradyrhizobium elkanii]MCW2380232.1 hypothetical protein [Bradyrhizobium elkanii]BBC03891.1 transposase [Bradyrhizobium elkanii USDA 61]